MLSDPVRARHPLPRLPGTSDGREHRIHHAGLHRDFSLQTYPIRWDDIPAFAAICADITEPLSAQEACSSVSSTHRSPSNVTELYRELLNCSDTMIQVSDFQTREILYANRAAIDFAGRAPNGMAGKTCYEFLFGRSSPCPFCQLCRCGETEGQRDVVLSDRCYLMNFRQISWNGRDAFIEYMRDITTARKYAEAELEVRNASFSAVDSALSGGTIIDRLGLDLPPLYVSSNCENFLGYSLEEFKEMYTRQYKDIIHPEDYPQVLAKNRQHTQARPKHFEMEFRFIRKDGSVFWFLEKGTYLDDFQGEPAYLSILIDISEQKRTEQVLFERNAIFDVLLETSGLSMWTYDIRTKRATPISSKKHRRPMSLGGTANYKESVITTGIIHEESMEPLRQLIRKVDEGGPSVSGDIWYQPADGDIRCDKVTYVNIRNGSGKIIRTVGIAEDVTEQRLAQQQFNEELRYSESAQSEKLLVKVRCNLSQSKVESYIAKGSVRISMSGMPYDQGIEALAATGYTEEQQNLIRRRTHDGRVLWVNSTVKTYRDLKSGDIESFMYTTDINDEKTNEELIYTVATTDCDYIALINLDTNEYRLFTGSVNDAILPSTGTCPNYAQSVIDIDTVCVHPEDVHQCIRDNLALWRNRSGTRHLQKSGGTDGRPDLGQQHRGGRHRICGHGPAGALPGKGMAKGSEYLSGEALGPGGGR